MVNVGIQVLLYRAIFGGSVDDMDTVTLSIGER